MIQLGLSGDDVRFHKEWSGKNCPHRILDEIRGGAFKAAIKKCYNELKKGDKAPAKAEAKPKPTLALEKWKEDDMYRMKIDGKNRSEHTLRTRTSSNKSGRRSKGEKKKIEVERV